MASSPPATSRHRSSGEATPPGYRHAIPTIATASSPAAIGTAATAATGASTPDSRPPTNSATATDVG
ncbi:hypothetical protein PS9374_07221 [Planomonospora sphaerica]|uniref:Uncharacterized protein n=1 Tax=Planomonospora sphaerica TaxID=161355 RepID=A0A171DR53_9ACTN|nr:hypothetical protein PS9374_07221 [Planomonospora sphaerica]